MNSRNWDKAKTAIGGILIDLGKLSFASLMLGSILRGGLDPVQTFISGTAVAGVFFIVGIRFIAGVRE